MTKTGFYWHESTFWHSGGNYASLVPVGGLVQPTAMGGLPENPETKRRLKNLIDLTGLSGELDLLDAEPATEEDLLRVHPQSYLSEFKRLSDAGGGELGQRTPFGPGGYEIAKKSAGLAKAALASVLSGEHRNAYSLSRPPGHHCTPDTPMGFCLMANIPIAIEAAKAAGLAKRFVVIDCDVHHGNGTEATYLSSSDVLAISLHQEYNYPPNSGDSDVRGEGEGEGFNLNIPLPPGCGHDTYVRAFDRIVAPAVRNFRPDAVIIACGYDASDVDPLGRMILSARTFAALTEGAMNLAEELCQGKLMMAHEGGYSEVHVPFCGHAVLQRMSGSNIVAEDPFELRISGHQPTKRIQEFQNNWVDDLADYFAG